MRNCAEITEMELEYVNGGTFTSNMFTEDEYHSFGIKTKYHFFEADEFTLPDGTHTNHAGANAYVKAAFPEVYAKREQLLEERTRDYDCMGK